MNDASQEPAVEKSTREQSPTDVERQTPRALFSPGDPLPNLEMWVLERRLGAGGFGEVWLARHERKGEAAVKFCTDPAARHTLVTHERIVVARVMKHCGNHPNVVPLLECNLSGDIPWLMYEYVKGGTLAEALTEWRALSPPRRLGRAVRTLRALAGALGQFHRLDPPLVHRDMKPHNVLMAGNVPRITDFGIGGAALVAQGNPNENGSSLVVRVPIMLQTVGSSKYAPQEQFLGSLPSPRDDVFALGVIAYQMILADVTAIPGPDAVSELRRLRVPAEFVLLIARSIALDPERRPKDATEWEDQLASLLRKKTVAGRQPALPTAGDPASNDPTDLIEVLSESDFASPAVSQTLDLMARGRWYARPIGQPHAEWSLVAATPAAVRVGPGEVYRFSIHSAATKADVEAIGTLAGLTSLRYLNLSYCAGVTDAGLMHLKALPGLRQLYLRGCSGITDAGLVYLHDLTDLHTLELIDCEHLTAAGIAALQNALPKCKVLR